MKKKIVFFLMSIILIISILPGCGKDVSDTDTLTYSDVPLKEVSVNSSDANYYKNLYEAELYNFKIIKDIPILYEDEQWNVYYNAGKRLLSINVSNITENQKSIIDSAKEERLKLLQIKSYTENVLFIWGDEMPSTVDSASLTFTPMSEDQSEFSPFLLSYLLEDQSQVKGNLIVISGGGYSSRANIAEGYPTAEAMNQLGYNCFILQRRVAPYNKEDTWMDLQRSIRYLRFNAETLELGGIDCIAAVGFSGGSSTLLGTISNLYGDVQPTIYDSSYIPDEVDAVNSDLTVAIPIYGPVYSGNFGDTYEGLVTDNPSLPAMLIIAGQNDTTGAPKDCITLFSSVTDKTDVELYIFALNGHGFGAGKAGTNSQYWPNMAATFMEEIVANQ